MQKLLILAFIFHSFVLAATAQDKTAENEMPVWAREHFEFMTRGSGRWVTDNSKYKSENEPYDEYATEYTWGIGKKSVKGRLLALKDKKEVGIFWEYYAFWHPKEKRVVFQQIGGNGVFGTGEMHRIELPGGQTEDNLEMTFYSPDGTSWKDLHKLKGSKDEHITQSFNLANGVWKPRRTYVWRRVPATTASIDGDIKFTNDPENTGVIRFDRRQKNLIINLISGACNNY